MDIVVVDFGSQYTQLIVTLLQSKIGVPVRLIPYTQIELLDVNKHKVKGFILSGGPKSMTDGSMDNNRVINVIQQFSVPILGICFGLQYLVNTLGGQVEKASESEFGKTNLFSTFHDLSTTTTSESVLLSGIDLPDHVWMSHTDIAAELPVGFKTYASTSATPHAVIENNELNIFAVQFHPEVKNTVCGKRLIKNFLKRCRCKGKRKLTILNQLQEITNEIKALVPEGDKVLLALSGGVDSTVLSEVLHLALPDRVVCFFIDHGMMRKNEVEEISSRFEHIDGFSVVNAKDVFLEALKGVTDPERKRKIIGAKFIEVFENQVSSDESIKWLAQGTIYPDIIESCGLNKTAKTIKSHHNVGGLPEKLNLKLLEPFKYFFKDQIREFGKELKLQDKHIKRHPFPGPGLGIRIIGEVTEERIKITQEADDIFMNMLRDEKLYFKVDQAYAGFLPVKTVGVVGDNRRYGWIIVLRAVNTIDFMTATAYEFPKGFLSRVKTQIINKIPEVARVVYDVTDKPPGTIELE